MINTRNLFIALIVLSSAFFYSHFIMAEGPLTATVTSQLGVGVGDVKTETEVNVKSGSNTEEGALKADINLKPKTSAYLHAILDKVNTVIGARVLDSESAACSAVDSAYESLSTDETGSLAWTSGSYSGSREDGGKLKGAQAKFFENVKIEAASLNKSLDGISSSSDSKASVATFSRSEAFVRSSLVDYLFESKKSGGPDGTRLAKLSNIIDNGILCLKGKAGTSEGAVAKITALETSSKNLRKLVTDAGGTIATGSATATDTENSLNIVVDNSTALSDTAVEITDFSKVKTEADLTNYANTLIKNDDNIKKISVTDENVAVRYGTEGKFLGIFTSHISTKATVLSNGDIKVTYPWYGFLFTKKNKLGNENVRAGLLSELGVKSSASEESAAAALSMQSSFSSRAKLLGTISNTLKKLSEAEVSVDESAETETETSTVTE